MSTATVTGTNGGQGQAGGPAAAVAATEADSSNTATATGGDGGNAGFDSGQNAGSGGDAQASATTTLQSAGATSATATATGGAGGSGIYNEPGGAGAPGGSATASAEDTGAAAATAIASATGGAGGYGAGGGVASGVTAYASGTASALASAEQTGGNSGGGRYGGVSPGVSSTLTNAVGGETDNGSLTLEQTAVGGVGGYCELAGGSDGGAATSSLTFDDTQNTTQSASLTVDISAAGGVGGGGEGAGGGGDATAGATITGASEVNVTVSAVGGAGGSGVDFNGGIGAATANANVTSTNGPATANVTATGAAAVAAATVSSANGPAIANVTASGGSGNGSASATSSATGANSASASEQNGQASASANGTSTPGTLAASVSMTGLVTADSATVSGVVSGASNAAEAAASVGDAASAFTTGEQALAVVTAEPDPTGIADVTNANSSIAAAFADNPSYLGLAELGGAATATIAGAQTITDNIEFTVSNSESSSYLVLGYYDGTATGSGFSNLVLTVAVNGTTELNQSFAGVASLDNYFNDNVVGIGLLGDDGPTLNLDLALSMTTTTPGSGYDFGVVVGTAPATPPTINGSVAGQAINDEQTSEPFGDVTITDANAGAFDTITVTLSNSANGMLSDPDAASDGSSYNAATGVYTVSGQASAVTAIIRSLIFTPTAHQVAPGDAVTTTFTVDVNDELSPMVSNSTTTVITTALENPPTISGTAAGQAIEDSQSTNPFAGVVIGEVDNPPPTLAVTVSLSDAANGTLSDLGGGYYDSATGAYSISGPASAVTAALDSLVFTPTEHQVAAGSTVTTTFTIGVTDGLSPVVSNSTTSVIATGTQNSSAGPLVAITGTDALVKSGENTTTTIVGTVSDAAAQVTSVEVYSDGAPLGAATLNADGSWSYAATFAAGTYSDIVAVATDSHGATASVDAPFVLETGITGQPYTAEEKTYDSAGALTGRIYFNYDGSVYTAGSVEALANGGVGYLYATGTVLAGQSYSSYETYFADSGDEALYEGATTNYTGIGGEPYDAESVSVDPYNRLTAQAFTAAPGEPFSSYEYNYVGGVFSGSTFTYTSVPSGASYSCYEVDYNQANALSGETFFFTGITGQDYTGEEADYDGNGNLTRVLLTGVQNQAYSSLELDYSAGTYEGYKAFYKVTGATYAGEEVDVTAANVITSATFTGLTGTPYSSVTETCSNGAVATTTYDFTDQDGQGFNAYQVTEDANGNPLQEVVDNDDGTHTIVGYQNGQTFTTQGDDTFTGGGSNETFVFDSIYGHDAITDFATYLTGAGHDTISLPTSEFANAAAVLNATVDAPQGAVITAADGDTIFLMNVSKAMLAANSADLAFHS